MVTMSDIAQACGVSRSVVSLVLNGREKEVGIAQQTRDRIMAAAEEPVTAAMNWRVQS